MPRSLSQRGIEAFRAVMITGSVSSAADMLNISQPAVSRLIRDLEDRLDLTLFVRTQGRVQPTAEAQELDEEVERAFVGLGQIEKAAQAIRAGQRGTIAVAAMPALAQTVLPEAFVHLSSERPELRFDLQPMRTHNVVRQVAARSAQLGFTSPLRAELAVDLIGTASFPYHCIMPAGHPLADREIIGVADLSDIPFVGFSELTRTGVMLDQHFSSMDRPPRVLMRAHLSSVVSSLVIRGMGIAVVDPFTASEHIARGGAAARFDVSERFSYAIIKPLGQRIGPELRAILEAFEAATQRFAL